MELQVTLHQFYELSNAENTTMIKLKYLAQFKKNLHTASFQFSLKDVQILRNILLQITIE